MEEWPTDLHGMYSNGRNMCICRNIALVYSVAVIMAVVEGCIFPLAFGRTVY